jgi:hypothetical protein
LLRTVEHRQSRYLRNRTENHIDQRRIDTVVGRNVPRQAFKVWERQRGGVIKSCFLVLVQRWLSQVKSIMPLDGSGASAGRQLRVAGHPERPWTRRPPGSYVSGGVWWADRGGGSGWLVRHDQP